MKYAVLFAFVIFASAASAYDPRKELETYSRIVYEQLKDKGCIQERYSSDWWKCRDRNRERILSMIQNKERELGLDAWTQIRKEQVKNAERRRLQCEALAGQTGYSGKKRKNYINRCVSAYSS